MMIADGKCQPEKVIGLNVNIISDGRILNYYIHLRQNRSGRSMHISALTMKNRQLTRVC